ncbi:MAG: riboflavin synthase [bacterium]|nr:riboflavin synthase [bacterium]MDD5354587.1 riboflavin synthase [bacterium]MDD5756849.1 riboflavin synthase [bacterium]
MFTGIIQQLGKVTSKTPRLLSIKCLLENAIIGESIAVNGTCLSLKRYDANNRIASFDIMAATLRTTNLGKLKASALVNIERALKVGDAVGGHFINGHIDETGSISRIRKSPGAVIFEIKVSKKNLAYINPKGSIAIDGISLTILDKLPQGLSVSLIPLTLKGTTLGFRKPGDKVNIEYDQIVKSTINILEEKFRNQGYITIKYLKNKGF